MPKNTSRNNSAYKTRSFKNGHITESNATSVLAMATNFPARPRAQLSGMIAGTNGPSAASPAAEPRTPASVRFPPTNARRYPPSPMPPPDKAIRGVTKGGGTARNSAYPKWAPLSPSCPHRARFSPTAHHPQWRTRHPWRGSRVRKVRRDADRRAVVRAYRHPRRARTRARPAFVNPGGHRHRVPRRTHGRDGDLRADRRAGHGRRHLPAGVHGRSAGLPAHRHLEPPQLGPGTRARIRLRGAAHGTRARSGSSRWPHRRWPGASPRTTTHPKDLGKANLAIHLLERSIRSVPAPDQAGAPRILEARSRRYRYSADGQKRLRATAHQGR